MGEMRIALAVLAVTAAFAAPLVMAGITADDRPALARSQPEAGKAFSFDRGAVPLDRPSRSVDIAVLRRAAALPAMKAPTRRRVRTRPAGGGGVRQVLRTSPQAPALRALSRSASSDTTPTAPAPARAPAPAPARPAPSARPAPAPRAPSKPAPSRPAPDDFDFGNSFDSIG